MNDSDRCCTSCGKSVEDETYQFWLFHTCRSCAAERAPARWRDGIGTARKWRYFPRWHMTADGETTGLVGEPQRPES